MATDVASDSAVATKWHLKGVGYEFCNCAPGCTCNFSGFPSSKDGSCKAAVANVVSEGRCGDVDLGGVTALAIIDWPKAIHDGGGKVVFVVPPSVSEEQVNCLAQIYTGQLGGLPWSILGTTYEVGGLVRADVNINPAGRESSFSVPGVGEAKGDYLTNAVTGKRHEADINVADGYIFKKAECGVGSFKISAEGINLDYKDTNWILYDFDWNNDE